MFQDDHSFLPREVLEGLVQARRLHRRKSGGGMRVQVGQAWYPIRAYDETGFEVARDDAPKLRGLVEIHDGARMVRSALIVAAETLDGAIRYGFKRATAVRSTQPLDYETGGEAPAGGYLTAR